LILVEGTGKDQLKAGQQSVAEATALSHCSLLRNARQKPTGVLQHCREQEADSWFFIFQGVSF
jgi:hypothetical protein